MKPRERERFGQGLLVRLFLVMQKELRQGLAKFPGTLPKRQRDKEIHPQTLILKRDYMFISTKYNYPFVSILCILILSDHESESSDLKTKAGVMQTI